jgi:hypothetical protein
MRRPVALALATVAFLVASCASAPAPDRIHVTTQADEAEAVLAIVDARAAGRTIDDAMWQRLFATEGYVRLKKRELLMHRPFEDDTFRAFVLSPELVAKREVLARTLAAWRAADMRAVGARALAYLPPSATITATIYPVIKPRPNSFVFEGNAILETIDDIPRERFENIAAHEMHHIGYGTACPPANVEAEIGRLPDNLRIFARWIGAFGEGFAVLAAAGGPNAPPEGAQTPEVQAAFEQGLAEYDANFHTLERFYLDILDARLTGDAADKRGFEFFGLVGPWYTVGWKLATTIETTLGRDALLGAFCDQRTLFAVYNRAAAIHEQRTGEKLPRWNERLVRAFTTPSSGTPAHSPR